LQSLGFLASKVDISLFHYHKGSVTMYLLVYVDDIIIASSSSSIVDVLLGTLNSAFALKDLGSLSYFLGIEVKKVIDNPYLSQAKYTFDVLHHAGMLTCKPVTTPLATTSKLSTPGGELSQ
jgi:hypothetical protein